MGHLCFNKSDLKVFIFAKPNDTKINSAFSSVMRDTWYKLKEEITEAHFLAMTVTVTVPNTNFL